MDVATFVVDVLADRVFDAGQGRERRNGQLGRRE